MRPAVLAALLLGAALSAIIVERRDAFGHADPLADEVDELVHSGQCATIDAIQAAAVGTPFDDATLPGLTLPNPDDVPAVTQRFIACGAMSTVLYERRQEYGPEDEYVVKLAPVVHAEQEACFALLTAQPAAAVA